MNATAKAPTEERWREQDRKAASALERLLRLIHDQRISGVAELLLDTNAGGITKIRRRVTQDETPE